MSSSTTKDLERDQSDASKKSQRRASLAEHDAEILAQVTGHESELSRQFGFWSMFALSFSVLGTWSTLAQNMATGLSNGGSITILWSLVIVTICNLCVAASLAELTSAMPTALGQAYWVFRLMSTEKGRFLSYMTAWTNTFGWWALTASQSAFMQGFMLALKNLYSPDWSPGGHGAVEFAIYIGITILLTIINATSCRRDKLLPAINSFVGSTYILLFFVFVLALLIAVGVKKDLKFQSAKFVFGTWLSSSSWPDGVTYFLGLLQSAYGLTAFDAGVHMIEELPDAARTGPRVIWSSVLVGAVTGWLFMAVCLASIQDVDSIVNAGFPFVQLLEAALGATGAVVLLALFIISGVGQNIGLTTTGSRLTWSFARDGGIPFSDYFAKVDTYWRVPVRAIWLQAAVIALIGVLYLFATTVLQAVLAVSTIALTISYAIPISVLLIVGRDKLPANAPYRLGRFGTVLNVVSVIYCAITTVFFFFPSEPSPSPADMNYAIAVFGVVLLVALGFWFIRGRKSYLRTETSMFRIMTGQQEHDGTFTVPGLAERINDGQVLVIKSDAKSQQMR